MGIGKYSEQDVIREVIEKERIDRLYNEYYEDVREEDWINDNKELLKDAFLDMYKDEFADYCKEEYKRCL